MSPKEWSDAHLKVNTPEQVAIAVSKGKLAPWSSTLLAFTRSGEKVLDLGSGTGSYSAFLACRGRETALLDFSQRNLDFSSKLFEILGLRGKFFKLDMEKPLPFEDNSFDTVFTIGVLEYFSDEKITHVLKEAFRISKKKIIVMTPNAFSIAYRVGRWYSKVTLQWEWGVERPFFSLSQYFKSVNPSQFLEFTVGTRQSFEFLNMFKGLPKKALFYILKLKDNSKPARFRQGFVLVSVGCKGQVHK